MFYELSSEQNCLILKEFFFVVKINMFFLEIAMLNGYSGIRTRNFGLCLPSLLVGQTMTRQSWTGSLDKCPDPQLDYYFSYWLATDMEIWEYRKWSTSENDQHG